MKHEGGFVLSPKVRADVWLPLSMRFSEAVLPEDSAKIGKKVYRGTRRWLRAAISPHLLRWCLRSNRPESTTGIQFRYVGLPNRSDAQARAIRLTTDP